ncbi:hypothetical protein [Herbidospora daliensis]|uniref:hypothetical protein n=1 Tax=Herbidospora daliensis TaxID=295585 RepID=UPI000780AC0D|nr:hypothetical protein [Herbidospora daliensis]
MFTKKQAPMETDDDDPVPILDLARTEGFEVFQQRVDEGDEVAQGLLAEWGVDDLATEKGFRAWFGNVHGVSEGTTPAELLTALDDVPEKDDDGVWKSLARLLGFSPDTASAEKIIAGTVVRHVMDADEEVRGQIEEFFDALGKDLDDYDLELARQGGVAIFGDPAADKPKVAATRLNDGVRRDTAERLRSIKDGMVSKVVVDTPEQRSLDRLAWVLANLKAGRECVAVVTMLENEIRLFANSADAGLGADFKRLFDAAVKGQRQAADDISAMFDEMVGQKLEVRVVKDGKLPPDVLRRGERRLRKTLDFLASLEKDWDDLRVLTHQAARGMKIHAETQAGDVLLRQREKALGEEAGWSDDEDVERREKELKRKIDDGKRARLSRRITDAKIAIGISKLCCFKCWLMIQALKAKGINLSPSGTHAKTYGAGWPAPASLAKPSLLRAFLQIPEDEEERTDLDGRLLKAMSTADGRAAIVTEIVSFTDKGQLESGYESSGDESEVSLTLWKDYYEDDDSSSEEVVVEKPKRKAPAKPKQVVRKPAPVKVVEPDTSGDDDERNASSDDDFVTTARKNQRADDPVPRRVTRSSGLQLPGLVGSAYPADPGEAKFAKRKDHGGDKRKTPVKRRKTGKKK